MKKLILLIATSILSLNAFSQTVTKTPSTDTTVVVLPVNTVRKVIKELIAYDIAKQEIIVLDSLIQEKDSLNNTYIRVITSKDSQINNLQTILLTRNEQLEVQTTHVTELESALKKQKIKNKILKFGNIGGVVAGLAVGFFILK